MKRATRITFVSIFCFLFRAIKPSFVTVLGKLLNIMLPKWCVNKNVLSFEYTEEFLFYKRMSILSLNIFVMYVFRHFIPVLH
jgi:hypothetical protein